jgi:hypothetical protein
MPVEIRPATHLKPNDKLGIIVANNADGTMTIVRICYFEKPTKGTVAKQHARGTPYVPLFRGGPWAFKKAFQALIDRIPGFHVDWAIVTKKVKQERGERWEVPDDELDAGIHFINNYAPESNGENEQWLFIEKTSNPPADPLSQGGLSRKYRMR